MTHPDRPVLTPPKRTGTSNGAPPEKLDIGVSLRALLRERTEQALRSAAQNGGDIPHETARQLRDLSFALKAYERSEKRRPSWLPEFVAITVVAIVVAWLHFTEVSSLTVDLRATSTHVAFTIAEVWDVSDAGKAFRVTGIHGFTSLWIPPEARHAADPSTPRGLSLETHASRGARSNPSEITADPIQLGPLTRVAVRQLDRPGTFAVDLSGTPMALQATAFGAAKLATATDTLLVFERARALRIAADSGATLLMTVPPKFTPVVGRSVAVSRLRFEVEDVFESQSRAARTTRSSLVSASATTGLGGQIDISDGVAFDSIAGRLLHLAVGDSAIQLRFQGEVFGMRDAANRTLMPSRLSWMRTFERQHLLVGTIGSILGALLLVLRRMRGAS